MIVIRYNKAFPPPAPIASPAGDLEHGHAASLHVAERDRPVRHGYFRWLK
jgi:hypothetical protein